MGVTDLDTLKQKDFSFTPESLRVRCPHCRKLYLVQRSDIRETRPRFECVQCHERFWLSAEEVDANQEMVGLPIQVREAPKPQRVEPCPKCRAPISVGSLECSSCGVVVNKWRAARSSKDSAIAAGDLLQRQWQKVMDAFTHGPTHMDFITACRRENNLAFAAQQYGTLAKVLPGDEQIQQRVREIEALAIAEIPPTEKRFRPKMPRVWQVPLIAGSAMLIIGLVMPVFRNLIGVGAALIFMSAAIKWQLKD
jgi:hypothetical protein